MIIYIYKNDFLAVSLRAVQNTPQLTKPAQTAPNQPKTHTREQAAAERAETANAADAF